MDNYPVDSTELRGRGTKGVMAAVGGLGLLGVSALITAPVIGWIICGGLVFLGITGLFGKSKTDKTTGTLLVAAGIAGLAGIFLPGLTRGLLGAGAFALIGFGAWNIFKFVKGLRDRA
jgi:hypothetical protein